MATNAVDVTAGTGTHVATNTITEDAETKHLQRVVINDSSGGGGTASLDTINSSLTTVFGTSALDQGSGNVGAHTLRVAVASDQLGPAATASTGAAVPAGAVYDGYLAQTALPTAATAGNIVGGLSDKFGRQIVLPVTIRDLVGTQTTTISASTSETTIVTAGAAGVFNDLICLIISNTSASTNTRIDIRDATAGSIVASIMSIGGAAPVGIPFMGVPIPQTTAANNWTAQCSASTTDIRVYAVYAKNK